MDYDEEDDDHKRLAEDAGVGEEGNAPTVGSGQSPYPPDEELQTRRVVDSERTTVSLLKVPDFVIEQWSHVKERGVELGRLRVYDKLPGETSFEQEFLFRFPPNAEASSSTQQPEYLAFTQTNISGVEGKSGRKYLLREKDRMYDFSGKSRQEAEPRIFAQVDRELLLTPKDTDKDMAFYKKLINGEAARAESSKKKTRVLSAAEQRDLKRSAAVIRPGVKSTLLAGRPAKRDNFVRTHKSVLIDTMLQSCFKEYKYWNLKGMCERLQQPAAFVKTVLQEVAEYQTSGPYHGYWCLKPSLQKTTTALEDSSPAPLDLAPDDVKPTADQLADLDRRKRERDLDRAQLGGEASDEEEDDDDEDDEDMEEVDV